MIPNELNNLGNFEYNDKNYAAVLNYYEQASKLKLGEKACYGNKADALISLPRRTQGS